MSDGEDLPRDEADRAVEREEVYEHEEYGDVKVTGIWRGINEVDEAKNTNDKDIIIVRFSTQSDEEQVDELTDTLPKFLDETTE